MGAEATAENSTPKAHDDSIACGPGIAAVRELKHKAIEDKMKELDPDGMGTIRRDTLEALFFKIGATNEDVNLLLNAFSDERLVNYRDFLAMVCKEEEKKQEEKEEEEKEKEEQVEEKKE